MHQNPALGLTYDIEFTPAVDADPAITSTFVVRIGCQLRIANQAPHSGAEDSQQDDLDGNGEAEVRSVASADFEYAAVFDYALREGDDGPARKN